MRTNQFLFVLFSVAIIINTQSLPVAIFHGIGDSCLFPGMSDITNYFSQQLGGAYAECIESGGGPLDWFTSFKHQSEKACEKIKSNPKFAGDFSVVGLSQGALIARYIIEKCDIKGNVRRYVSIGGPQMGVGSFPQCTGGVICEVVNKVVGSAVYFSLIQSVVGPAGYFKDISNYNTYLNYSTFLAELNNEKDSKADSLKERFLGLEKVVLIKFSQDTMIIPKETTWFQFYNKDKKVEDLKESEFYQKDFLGVRTLVEAGKIDFVELEGNHLNFEDSDIDNYMIPALK